MSGRFSELDLRPAERIHHPVDPQWQTDPREPVLELEGQQPIA